MALYRRDRAQLNRMAALQAGPSAEHVLRPPDSPGFATPQALTAARAQRTLVAIPGGKAGAKAGVQATRDLVLRPEALAVALYLGAGVRAIAPGQTPLWLVSATVDSADLSAAAARVRGAVADPDPIHATGDTFDVRRTYASPAEAEAFQFVLERLQALGVIAWRRLPGVIQVVVGPRADRLLSILPRA
jgi:hypothetical protein